MGLNKYTFDDVYRYYDDAGRDRSGSYRNTEAGLDPEKQNTYNFNYVQKFVYDYQNEPNHDIVMYTYANGIKFVWESEYIGDQQGNHVISGPIKVYSKNVDVTSEFRVKNPDIALTQTIQVGDNYPLSSIEMFTTNMFWYTGASEHPQSLYINWITTRKNNVSPYDPPDLNGFVNITNYSTYYYDNFGIAINDDITFDKFMDSVVDLGDGTPITPILPSEDTSQPGGGDDANPDYNPFSDSVDFPGLPTGGGALATGFIRVYEPTASQLQALAGELWSDSFVDTIKKIQNDPMEAVISLHSIPFSVAGGTATCKIGNYTSGVTMPVVAGQFAKRNLGSIHIPEHWASALDYAPYVTIDIYLPYIGVRSLQVDDVIGKTLSIEYNVDVLSGATVANIKCGSSVLYTFNTSLILEHPISQSSFAPMYQSIVGAAGNVLSGYGSAGAPGAAGSVIGSAINVALSKQHSVSRGGSIGGSSGCLGGFTPYLIIHRPIQSLASGFAHFKGYPSNITGTISSVSGYTEVESVHLNNITCTDAERDEIMALLYNGVIV